MKTVPAMRQPGHQIGKQRKAKCLGHDDHRTAAGGRRRHVDQSAGTRTDDPDRSAAAMNTDSIASVSQYPLTATLLGRVDGFNQHQPTGKADNG